MEHLYYEMSKVEDIRREYCPQLFMFLPKLKKLLVSEKLEGWAAVSGQRTFIFNTSTESK